MIEEFELVPTLPPVPSVWSDLNLDELRFFKYGFKSNTKLNRKMLIDNNRRPD